MTVDRDNDLEGQITEWRAYMHRRRELHHTDAEELEDHLRSRITELTEAGLRADEAFLIAVKRMGSLDELSREFAREHSERLWKQLVLPREPDAPAAARSRRELLVMVLCAAVAALAIKVPGWFGLDMSGDDAGFYARNVSLFALPALAAYFAWQRRVGLRVIAVLALLFILGAVAANAYPLADDSQTTVLTAIHLPLALWLVVGVAYVGGDWRSDRRRMDFIRFTGEWLIYFSLIGLGGGVLMAFTMGTFRAIGLDAEGFVQSWLLPCGAMAAVIVSAWLVEAKQSVIENMAPVLTRVFTPLFAATLLAFLVAIIWTNNGIDVERDALILFDLLLVIVLGLLLYAISARDLAARPGLFDRLQLALVVSALIIDVMVLLAITGRITEWGFSPNKTAALGENVILLTNLAWSAWLFLGFVRGRMPFARLEHWQTRYMIVYAVWAWTVVLVFPPVFDFA
ncbi:cytochrome bd-type quinol oxidase subunit 2 [Micromonospora kangleipakensis]|uniref:Cytochrome bd-type quinol oxidase subunit 2 n=1 Tax=Micromonospora kangleipakensis TaxID=1077942 RepID=A0A4Q8BD51_9ACTN|nr:permease prefix domain 1-containing protein [Micromonospora kangleipakensis]RZU75807.1 cytochrome bd-type quinol oxidase subunit 2 [Micromonospora kangleipakensis]